MNRAARLVLPALSLAAVGIFSGACGSSDGTLPGSQESTGVVAQPVLCLGRGGIHTECTAPPDPITPKPRPVPIVPIRAVAPAFPATVDCAAGETCWFYPQPNFTGFTIPCSPPQQFAATTSTATNGYAVSYCNTVATGLASVQSWIAANPTTGAKLVFTALDGLPTPPANYGYLVYDQDPAGPALPSPISCTGGLEACPLLSDDPYQDEATMPCSPTYEVTPADGSALSFIAYCSTAGAWAGIIDTWARNNWAVKATYGADVDGFPTAASGFTYIQFYGKNIGIHCDTCGGDSSGGSSSGGGGSGSSSSSGGTVQD